MNKLNLIFTINSKLKIVRIREDDILTCKEHIPTTQLHIKEKYYRSLIKVK